jgi:ribonuclease Z
MPKLIFLGTSNAIPHADRDNTHMLLVGEQHIMMVDCGTNPLVRLQKVGLDVNSLTDLVLTHFHPDHVGAAPALLMDSWLLGRRRPLNIYGLDYTLDRLIGLMNFYDWKSWPNFFPITFHRIPEEELAPVISDGELKVFASPVHHLLPTIGLRVEFPSTGKVLAYSCDTQPCDEVARLAGGADVLIHEAAGPAVGHSSPAQAGSIARQAEVRQLVLIHFPTGDFDPQSLVAQARQNFPGSVSLAEDFMEISF